MTPSGPDGAPAVPIVARCVRPPVLAQAFAALPAAIWAGYLLATGAWQRASVFTVLACAAVATATPPLASAILRLAYGGRGALIREDDHPVLQRLGRRRVRGVDVAFGRAAVDAGPAGAFVVEPAADWLQPSGAAPWRFRVPARWVVAGAAVLALASVDAALVLLPVALRVGGAVLQFVLMPLSAALAFVALVLAFAALWPVTRVVPSDRSPAVEARPGSA